MNVLAKFPRGVMLVIDVVFPGEYRIGFVYRGVRFAPGSGSYFPFDEAIGRCYAAFVKKFPQHKEQQP